MSDARNTASPATYTHRVYSECHQAIAPGRDGYLVRGSSIYCPDSANAHRVANNIAAGLGNKAITIPTEGGTYYYATQEDAAADDTGTMAAAVVYALDSHEINELTRDAKFEQEARQ
jgi:hypothetical protein